MEFIIDTANAKGMCVTMLPAWGSCFAGSYVQGAPSKEVLFDAGDAYDYGQWLGQRYSEKENLIWMMGGDRSAARRLKMRC